METSFLREKPGGSGPMLSDPQVVLGEVVPRFLLKGVLGQVPHRLALSSKRVSGLSFRRSHLPPSVSSSSLPPAYPRSVQHQGTQI